MLRPGRTILPFLSLALFGQAFSLTPQQRQQQQQQPQSTQSTESTTISFANQPTNNRRRQLLTQKLPLVAPIFVWTPISALAVGEGTERMVFKQKPTAPIDALLPAIQQRLLLEAALNVLGGTSKQNQPTTESEKLQGLKSILPPLDESPNFNNQNGSQNSRVLKEYPPDKALRGAVIRATMNVYQLNLNYDNLLNKNPNDAIEITDPGWKKSYIRANDGLPDLPKIVGADIDMRQLLRNQVQLKIDDAAAELYANDCDLDELMALLQDAARNFDLWLDRVRAGDVRDAIRIAQKKS